MVTVRAGNAGPAGWGVLTFLLWATLAPGALSQVPDSARARTDVAGAVTVTTKGISTIPSFTLGKPAATFDLFVGRRGLSFEPQFRYGLDGKPWTFLLWGRYRLLDRERLHVSVGAHPALLFKSMSVLINQTPTDALVARRYIAADLSPSYALSRHVSAGAYYLYSYGVDRDAIRNTHFAALRGTFSGVPLTPRYVLRFAPQVYYVRTDARDGYYVNAAVALGRRRFPVSVGAMVNKALRTRITGEALLWNVSVSYAR